MSKRGRISHEETKYIERNCDELALDQMAAKMNRTIEIIRPIYREGLKKKQAAKLVLDAENGIGIASPDLQERSAIRMELVNSSRWQRLKEEFEPDELRYFEDKYLQFMAQFRDDILATEETQIFQLIKFEILMSRNLSDRKKMRKDISNLELLQQDMFEKEPNPKMWSEAQRDRATVLETTLSQSRSSEASKTTEFAKLDAAHQDLMKALKGTRDQRLERIEKVGVNFIEIIKSFQDKDFQEREMRQNELMKLATAKQYDKLGRPHVYEDGNQDSPILSCDTVNLGIEEEATK